MTGKFPIGLKEAQLLEFKDLRDLAEPSKLVRSIVAMLNSKGGKIWIGIDERDEIAVGVQDVKNPDLERRRLWDSIHDIVEPRLTEDDADIQDVEESGRHALCVVVKARPAPALHAVRVKDGAWLVPIRVDARTRPLSWQEIVSGASNSHRDEGDALDKSRMTLVRDRDKFLQRPGSNNLWIEMAPSSMTLDMQALSKKYPADFRELDSGLGYFSIMRRCNSIDLREDHVELTDESRFRLSAFRDGRVRLNAQLDLQSFDESRTSAGWVVRDRGADAPSVPELHPFELIAFVVIAFRVASRLYRENDAVASEDCIASSYALIGMHGVGLRSGSPTDMMWKLRMNAPKVSEEQVIGVHTDPIFSHEELTSTPDACAARVVTSVYAAFGIPKDEIPREINLDTGFVRLPGS